MRSEGYPINNSFVPFIMATAGTFVAAKSLTLSLPPVRAEPVRSITTTKPLLPMHSVLVYVLSASVCCSHSGTDAVSARPGCKLTTTTWAPTLCIPMLPDDVGPLQTATEPLLPQLPPISALSRLGVRYYVAPLLPKLLLPVEQNPWPGIQGYGPAVYGPYSHLQSPTCIS